MGKSDSCLPEGGTINSQKLKLAESPLTERDPLTKLSLRVEIWGLTDGEDEEFRFLQVGAGKALAPTNDSPGLRPVVPTHLNI